MSYPSDVYFDIETLVNAAQPTSILLLGDETEKTQPLLKNYIAQKHLLKQDCKISHIRTHQIGLLDKNQTRFDLGIVIDLFEHIDKQQGQFILSKLRDIHTDQYCIYLPIKETKEPTSWMLSDLFSFALSRVASYTEKDQQYGLFKYHVDDYKKTPDWLNSDNWSNPNMWDKYRW